MLRIWVPFAGAPVPVTSTLASMLKASELETCFGLACGVNVPVQRLYRFGSGANSCTAVGRPARLSFQRWSRVFPATVFGFQSVSTSSNVGRFRCVSFTAAANRSLNGNPNAARLGSLGCASVPVSFTLCACLAQRRSALRNGGRLKRAVRPPAASAPAGQFVALQRNASLLIAVMHGHTGTMNTKAPRLLRARGCLGKSRCGHITLRCSGPPTASAELKR